MLFTWFACLFLSQQNNTKLQFSDELSLDSEKACVGCRNILLGHIAVTAQRPTVVRLSRGRSVGLCVGALVGVSSALWEDVG